MNQADISVISANFVVIADNTLTEIDRKSLSRLYLPIVKDKAISLYSTLYTYLDNNGESKVMSHEDLFKLLNLNNSSFIENRKRLEALGLLSSYYKEGFFIYVLNRVLTPYEFFNNEQLLAVYSSIVGEEELNNVGNELLNRKYNPSNFIDITQSFDDVYEAVPVSNNQFKEGFPTANHGIRIKNEKFDINQFLILVDAHGVVKEEILNDSNFLDRIVSYAFLYNLNVEQMKDCVIRSVDINKNIDFNQLNLLVRNTYDEKKNPVTFVPNKEVVKSNDKTIRILETLSPSQIMQNLYKTKLTSSEIQMFDDILQETNVSTGVLNALMVYVLKTKNGELPSKNYFLKILNTWIRAGVKTTEDALNYSSGITKKYEPKKPTKNIKPTPEWYNKQNNESKQNVDDNDQELIDINEFFKK